MSPYWQGFFVRLYWFTPAIVLAMLVYGGTAMSWWRDRRRARREIVRGFDVVEKG